jgi:hypothetical protein
VPRFHPIPVSVVVAGQDNGCAHPGNAAERWRIGTPVSIINRNQ